MAKFKVGDWVTIKGLPKEDRFHVLEIVEQTCEAGIAQVIYKGRHLTKTRQAFGLDAAETEHRYFMSAREIQVREMELGEVVGQTPK